MKTIHSFTVKQGEKDVKFDIVSPSRSIVKESEMVYAKTYGQGVRAGLLTNAEALKIATERGGMLTEQEQTEYMQALNELFAKEQALAKEKKETEPVVAEEAKDIKDIKDGKEPKDEPKKRKKKESTLEIEIKGLKDKILSLQAKQDSVLANTAESKARDECIFFNTLFLTHKDGKPFFEGKNFEDKTNRLDAAMPNDEFLSQVFKKSLWYMTAVFFGVLDLDKFEYTE